jgi:Cu-Zn family superoxide dismutase
MKLNKVLPCLTLLFSSYTFANTTVQMHLASTGKSIGTVTLQDTRNGLKLIPHLHGLPPGQHGFHIHEHASCEDHCNAAGGHLDPEQTGKHLGPYNNKGHLGDLPLLTVNNQGMAVTPVVAPRLKIRSVLGHSLMIHEGGDNYSDVPDKLGGGHTRIACGSISETK